MSAAPAGRFCWLDLAAADAARAAEFYTELFGWSARSQAANGGTFVRLCACWPRHRLPLPDAAGRSGKRASHRIGRPMCRWTMQRAASRRAARLGGVDRRRTVLRRGRWRASRSSSIPSARHSDSGKSRSHASEAAAGGRSGKRARARHPIPAGRSTSPSSCWMADIASTAIGPIEVFHSAGHAVELAEGRAAAAALSCSGRLARGRMVKSLCNLGLMPEFALEDIDAPTSRWSPRPAGTCRTRSCAIRRSSPG